MHEVALFGEDVGHETLLTALLNRFAHDYGVAIHIRTFSSRGGFTKVHFEFSKFLKDVQDGKLQPSPDLIVLATDSNCLGYTKRRQQMMEIADKYVGLKDRVSYAVPDPHVERWMLVDPAAFKAVLGRGCTLPKMKCEKDEYKHLLEEEIRAAGQTPLIGGFEYAEDIVNEMNLATAETKEPSLEKILKDLRGRFNQWKNAQTDC
ncbi:MAG: DUF4276 family protein [Terriglobales bacterium]